MASSLGQEDEIRELMRLSLLGDAAAYRSLLTALSTLLRSYFVNNLVRYGRSRHDAEDLVQEALIAIHSRKSTYDPDQPLGPWVYGIARYKLVDYLRRRKHVQEASIEDLNEVGISGHSHTENSLDVDGLLAKIPPQLEIAVRLIKLEGATAVEAASMAGTSENAIRVNAHRGIHAMVAILKGRKRR